MSRNTLIPWVLLSLVVHLALLYFPRSSPSTSDSGPRRLDVGLVTLPPTVPPGAKPAAANPKPMTAGAEQSSKTSPVAASAVRSAKKSAPPQPRPAKPERAEKKTPEVAEPAPRQPIPAEPVSPPDGGSDSLRPSAKTANLPAARPSLKDDRPGVSASSPPSPGPEASPTQAEAATPPDYLQTPQPRYPRLARARRWEGEVLVRVEVASSGRVQRVLLERSSGYQVLDRSAMEGVRAWTFKPARRNGLAIKGEVVVPIRFELQRF